MKSQNGLNVRATYQTQSGIRMEALHFEPLRRDKTPSWFNQQQNEFLEKSELKALFFPSYSAT